MKEPRGCSTPFPASAASPAPPARGTGLGPPSLRGETWGLRLLVPLSLRPWDEAGPAKGRWHLGHGRRDPRAVDPQVPPSRLHAPAWIRAGSRGDLWRAAGKEGQRRCKQASRFHLVTHSRGCVPVPRSSPSPPLDPLSPGHPMPRIPKGTGTLTPRPRVGDAPGTPSGSESLINRVLIAWKTSHLSHAEGGAAWGLESLPPPWGHGVIPLGRAGLTPSTGTPPGAPQAGSRW